MAIACTGTLTTISADITSPITPNVTRNGTHGAIFWFSCARTVSQDFALSTVPAGSVRRTAATLAFIAVSEPALANR